MYQKNNFETTVPLDKKRKKDYTESNQVRLQFGAFDDDAVADAAVNYLYDKGSQRKTQTFLQNNGFPSAQDRAFNKQLYGAQEEQRQMRDLLKNRTYTIMTPTLPNENDRAFLHGLMGEKEGERDYQKQITDANRAQSDLLSAFRGTQFESSLKPSVPKREALPETKLETDDKFNVTDATAWTDVFKPIQEDGVAQSFEDNKFPSSIKNSSDSFEVGNPMRQVALNNTKGKSATQSTGKIYYEGNRGCINGQGSNPGVKDLYYGKDIIANNGCELLAVYNAMTLKDKKPNFKELIKVAETTKGVMWLDGRFGSHPEQLGKLFDHYEIGYTSTTQKDKFNKLLEDGGTYVISTWNPGALTIHTVAFSCDSENNIIVYNRYNTAVKPYKYESTGQQTGLDLFLKECGKEIIMYKLK